MHFSNMWLIFAGRENRWISYVDRFLFKSKFR